MQQVRAGRTQHVAAPPAGPTTLELSREERGQLRIVRNHAFLRHQRNTAWMREILQYESQSSRADTINSGQGGGDQCDAPVALQGSEYASSLQQQRRKLNELQRDASISTQRLEEQQKSLLIDNERHTDLFASLRSCSSEEQLSACRLRVMEESMRHTQAASQKEIKVVNL